jgi:hypothetical protein
LANFANQELLKVLQVSNCLGDVFARIWISFMRVLAVEQLACADESPASTVIVVEHHPVARRKSSGDRCA